jgi:hypothetical protein
VHWWVENADTTKEIKDGHFAARENHRRLKQAADDVCPACFQIHIRKSAEDDPDNGHGLHTYACGHQRQCRCLRQHCPDVDKTFTHAGDCPVCVLDKQAADAKREHVPTVAVDLDGTLARMYETFDAESIPDPRPGARKWMQEFRDAGARLIVFTTRGNTPVIRAWLEKHKIPFDHINENPDQPEGASGKVIADVYWDDRAVSAKGPLGSSGPEVLDRLKAAEDEAGWRFADPADVLQMVHMLKEACCHAGTG